ncbi:hypothetical protein GCM10025883_29220 [Mobilicoccus caccae]|uniref:Permease family protein n=1 Tax=Mobilicoccus caccae TaxID=1859295 RepID=A0ABQ6IUP6_9MICO|nr:hypothetical protein GCM10025883_29220 [Mobilicoccus caccae]
MPSPTSSTGPDMPTKRDATLAGAVELAREAAESIAEPGAVGDHIGMVMEGERLATHSFVCTTPAYRGWRWAVVVARVSRSRTVTVCETNLLPGDDAILSPAWVPYEQRLAPGDLGAGDVLPYKEEDPNLEPGFEATGEEDVDAMAQWELGLGRARVLSAEGRESAAQRWYDGDNGPDATVAQKSQEMCTTCGYYLPSPARSGRCSACAPTPGRPPTARSSAETTAAAPTASPTSTARTARRCRRRCTTTSPSTSCPDPRHDPPLADHTPRGTPAGRASHSRRGCPEGPCAANSLCAMSSITESSARAPRGGLDRYFKISERGSTVGREVRGGFATFFTMAYIVVLNPLIIGTVPDGSGQFLGGGTEPNLAMVAAGTALIAGLMSMLMGVFANYPLALAAGLGLNAFVAYSIASLPNMTWADAMGLVVMEGIVILLLVLTGFRRAVFHAIPAQLKTAISVGIGLFITLVGLVDAGIVRRAAGAPCNSASADSSPAGPPSSSSSSCSPSSS